MTKSVKKSATKQLETECKKHFTVQTTEIAKINQNLPMLT